VVGFDDNAAESDWVAPWLSSVRVPYDRFGPAIAATIKALLEERRALRTILPHRLVLRARG
jgi:LacI family transcriptional regulator